MLLFDLVENVPLFIFLWGRGGGLVLFLFLFLFVHFTKLTGEAECWILSRERDAIK